jgi:hypothetical protein
LRWFFSSPVVSWQPNTKFVEVLQQVHRILIDAISTGPFEFVLPVPAGEKSDPERIGTPCCKQVPNTVSDHY